METHGDSPTMRRRAFLAKASVAGGVAWAAPTLVSVSRADAAPLTSAPPTPPGPGPGPGAPVEEVLGESIDRVPAGPGTVGDPSVTDPATSAGGVGAASVSGASVARSGELARTGVDLDDLTKVGVGLLATGAGLKVWSADLAKKKALGDLSPPQAVPAPG